MMAIRVLSGIDTWGASEVELLDVGRSAVSWVDEAVCIAVGSVSVVKVVDVVDGNDAVRLANVGVGVASMAVTVTWWPC